MRSSVRHNYICTAEGDNLLNKKSPNLAHFQWWRIVADEAHEILTLAEAKQTKKQRAAAAAQLLLSNDAVPTSQSPGLVELSRLESKYRWYVTGTPFPHEEKSLAAAMKVRCFPQTREFFKYSIFKFCNSSYSSSVSLWTTGV